MYGREAATTSSPRRKVDSDSHEHLQTTQKQNHLSTPTSARLGGTPKAMRSVSPGKVPTRGSNRSRGFAQAYLSENRDTLLDGLLSARHSSSGSTKGGAPPTRSRMCGEDVASPRKSTSLSSQKLTPKSRQGSGPPVSSRHHKNSSLTKLCSTPSSVTPSPRNPTSSRTPGTDRPTARKTQGSPSELQPMSLSFTAETSMSSAYTATTTNSVEGPPTLNFNLNFSALNSTTDTADTADTTSQTSRGSASNSSSTVSLYNNNTLEKRPPASSNQRQAEDHAFNSFISHESALTKQKDMQSQLLQELNNNVHILDYMTCNNTPTGGCSTTTTTTSGFGHHELYSEHLDTSDMHPSPTSLSSSMSLPSNFAQGGVSTALTMHHTLHNRSSNCVSYISDFDSTTTTTNSPTPPPPSTITPHAQSAYSHTTNNTHSATTTTTPASPSIVYTASAAQVAKLSTPSGSVATIGGSTPRSAFGTPRSPKTSANNTPHQTRQQAPQPHPNRSSLPTRTNPQTPSSTIRRTRSPMPNSATSSPRVSPARNRDKSPSRSSSVPSSRTPHTTATASSSSGTTRTRTPTKRKHVVKKGDPNELNSSMRSSIDPLSPKIQDEPVFTPGRHSSRDSPKYHHTTAVPHHHHPHPHSHHPLKSSPNTQHTTTTPTSHSKAGTPTTAHSPPAGSVSNPRQPCSPTRTARSRHPSRSPARDRLLSKTIPTRPFPTGSAPSRTVSPSRSISPYKRPTSSSSGSSNSSNGTPTAANPGVGRCVPQTPRGLPRVALLATLKAQEKAAARHPSTPSHRTCTRTPSPNRGRINSSPASRTTTRTPTPASRRRTGGASGGGGGGGDAPPSKNTSSPTNTSQAGTGTTYGQHLLTHGSISSTGGSSSTLSVSGSTCSTPPCPPCQTTPCWTTNCGKRNSGTSSTTVGRQSDRSPTAQLNFVANHMQPAAVFHDPIKVNTIMYEANSVTPPPTYDEATPTVVLPFGTTAADPGPMSVVWECEGSTSRPTQHAPLQVEQDIHTLINNKQTPLV